MFLAPTSCRIVQSCVKTFLLSFENPAQNVPLPNPNCTTGQHFSQPFPEPCRNVFYTTLYRDGQKGVPRLREITPAAGDGKEAGCRNLGPTFLTYLYYTCLKLKSLNERKAIKDYYCLSDRSISVCRGFTTTVEETLAVRNSSTAAPDNGYRCGQKGLSQVS